MSLLLQAKLMRVLQEREVSRLGAHETRRVDVRLVAATNQELDALLRAGRFREDLYYRLNVVRITLPPLRERGDDILVLADYFLSVHRRGDAPGPQSFSADARTKLLSYSWPGNVRELENVIARAVLCARGRLLTAEDLIVSGRPGEARLTLPLSLDAALAALCAEHAGKVFPTAERLLISKALELSRQNQVKAARLLGISRNVLRDRMKRYGLLRQSGL
jgi:sigma-54-specific transcriptional regulator